MSLPSFILSAALLVGCASGGGALPAASPTEPKAPADPGTAVEVRHMYLFAPGKAPVKVVAREGAPAMRDAVSIEPPPAR
jgi:hypothetical protein